MIEGGGQAYPEYWDSGVEWVGKIPRHWNVCRLKHIKAKEPNAFVDGPFGSNLKSEHFIDNGDVYVIESNFATTGVLDTLQLKTISNRHYGTIKRSSAKEGDIIIAKIGARYGSSSILPHIDKTAVVSGNCLKLTVDSSLVNTNYVNELLRVSKANDAMDDGVNVTAQPALSLGGLNNLCFLRVPLSEQHQIANFLDHETAKIDTLIGKQQQLIALLKEKRQAVISHAVTKGLNPGALMKDSGVEWLGEVPEHWTVSRVKNNVTAIVDGPHFSPKYNDSGYMFISARNIKINCWSLDDAKFISEVDYLEFSKRVKPETGDVLLTKGGTTGVARAVDLDFDFQVWVHVAVLKIIRKRVNPFFMAYTLNGQACYEQSQLYTRGATNNDLGLSRIANIFLLVPSLKEQLKIVSFLNEQCHKIDELIEKSIKSMKLLQERRTALISAAVTGKIDVRNWQPPTAPQSTPDTQ